MTKPCSKCGEVKPLSAYNKKSKAKDGKRPECRDCHNLANRAYDAANVDRKRAYYQEKREGILAKMLEYYDANRETILERNAEYYTENRESIRTQRAEYNARPEVKAQRAGYSVEYHQEHPEVRWEYSFRTRAEGYGFVPVIESFTRDELIAAYGDQCFHCDGEWTELDHFPVAVAHGGEHSLENCRPSCTPCNRPGNIRRLNKTEIGETA